MTRSLPEMEFSAFFLSLSTWKWHPRCGLSLPRTIPRAQVVYRGPSELLNFCAFSERLDLFNLGGIFTFWQGALVPMDQFPDFAPGRGFTLALFWMIPTTCIPEGRMAPGLMICVNFCGPLRLPLRYFLPGSEPHGGRSLSKPRWLYWISYCPLLSGSDHAELEAASAAHHS